MCTGAEIAIGLAVAGAATSAYSSYKAGQAQSDAAHRQAGIDDKNQQIANQQAELALQDAEVKAGQIGDATNLTIARQRLAFSAGNVDVTSGTAAATAENTAQIGAHLQAMARLEGARIAYGYRSQGLQYGSIAAARRANAGDFSEAGYIGATGALIGGAGKTYAMGAQAGWWGASAASPGDAAKAAYN